MKITIRLTAAGAAMALLAAGCGGSSDKGTADSGSLRIIGTADTRAAITKVVDAFKAAHPKVKITTDFPQTPTYTTVTRTQLTGKKGPDVLLAWPGGGNAMSVGPLAKANALVDLSKEPWNSKVKPGWKQFIAHEGKTYIYPLGGDTMGVVYDKKVFAKHGVTPPTSLTGMIKLCATFKGKGIAPISYPSKEAAFFMLNALLPSTVYRVNSNWDGDRAAGKTTFADTAGWGEAMRITVKMRDAGCFNKGYEGTAYADMPAMVATGKAGMAVTVPASLPAIIKAGPDGEYAYFPLPAYDDPAKNYAAQALAVGFGVNTRSRNIPLAKKFVEFANSAKQAQTFAFALGDASLEEGAPTPAALEQIVAKWKENKLGPFPEQSFPNPGVQGTELAVMQQVLSGKITVPEALKQLDASYNGK